MSIFLIYSSFALFTGVACCNPFDAAGCNIECSFCLIISCATLLISVALELSRYSDSLRAERSGDQIPVGARFSAPVQTGPGVHPASYKIGTGSFPGVKRPGRGAGHPPPSSVEVEGRVELYI